MNGFIEGLLDKNDTKRFLKKSNRYFFRFVFYAFKNLFRPKISARYFAKAKSIEQNKRICNYPSGFVNSDKRVAVYTVLYGNYDRIKNIHFKNPRCDYFIFTDQELPADCDWKLKKYNFKSDIISDPVMKNRFLKMHPHLLFPDYEYSIYIDATIIIELDIMRLMARLGDKSIALFKHHAGVKCSYIEAERVKRIGLAPINIVDKQMNRYKNEGFPENFGFFECNIIIREHSNPECISIMETWWNEFVNESRRDQLSFMYSVWKNNKLNSDISCLGLTYFIEPILSGEYHKSVRNIGKNE